MNPRRAFRVPALVLLWLGLADSVLAQSGPGGQGDFEGPAWLGEVAFLGAGALIGGITAGVSQELRGGSFQDGFTRGSAGGAVAYAGRRLSAERFYGAGLAARQVSAMGASMVRNAGEGRPALERLFFPIGPVNVYVSRSGKPSVRAKLNLYSAAWTASAALRPELRFDLGKSLSAGAPVFHAPYRSIISVGDTVAGMAAGGTIFLSGSAFPEDGRIFAHERVHVLQADLQFHSLGEPIEAWAAQRTRAGSRLYRYVDLGVVMPYGTGTLYYLLGVDRRDRLREHEAYFLEER